jgi:pimeloyl-ACP methyl ester carboxylesterase
MDLVFVVPGIMGSELYLDGAKIWPPKMMRRVSNPDDLLDPSVAVGDLIRNVLVFGFYDKLLNPLHDWGYQEHQSGSRGLVIPWPYNWVRSVPDNAQSLAADIRAAIRQHPDKEVVLLAHSMGGLVCTYALECLAEPDVSWRDRVRLLVTFGTPFRGAPESLKNAFGVEGVMGIAARDCRRLMADPRFPSAYQLLPHLSTSSLWSGQPPLQPLQDYESLASSGPLLGQVNLNSSIKFQKALQSGTAIPNVRKFNFCGGRHNTVWSVGTAQSSNQVIDLYEAKAGDGTVPSWSGRQHEAVQFAPLGAKHSTTFGDDDLLDVLRELLEKPRSPSGLGPKPRKFLERRPTPPRQSQPQIAVTKNAISSLTAEIEVEVFEPPLDEMLNLSWIPLKGAETLDDVVRSLTDADFNAISAHHSMPIAAELGFPLQISIPRPQLVGEYALVAWSGDPIRSLGGLNVERMDVIWVFADDSNDGTLQGGSKSSVDAPNIPLSSSSAIAGSGELKELVQYME